MSICIAISKKGNRYERGKKRGSQHDNNAVAVEKALKPRINYL